MSRYVSLTFHYSDVIMSALASHITGLSRICWNICWGADQRRHQSSASLAFVRGIHRWPVDSPHKGPVTRQTFPFGDVIMYQVNILYFLNVIVSGRCSNLFQDYSEPKQTKIIRTNDQIKVPPAIIVLEDKLNKIKGTQKGLDFLMICWEVWLKMYSKQI